MDDPDLLDDTYELIGRLFLAMLARLAGKGLLGPQSPIRNLGLVMTLFILTAAEAREHAAVLGELKQEPLPSSELWEPQNFERYIVAFSREHRIGLVGLPNVNEVLATIDSSATLPAFACPLCSGDREYDAFNYQKALRDYKEMYAGLFATLVGQRVSRPTIGGDSLDITTWSSSERASCALDRRDPLSEEQMEAIRKGLVMMLG